jgi:transcriptional regulator with XRE-family HTH domain
MRKTTPLENLRRARTINQATLARLIGVSQQTLSKFEKGLLVPSPDVQERLAVILGTARGELFPPTEERVAS